MKNNDIRFVPCTPGGTLCFDLESRTKKQAIKKLLRATRHMPYENWEEMQRRGYTIERIEGL